MAGGTVGWHFLDVESGLIPDESSPSILPGKGRGRIVVLAATPFAMTAGWAARAAATIADEWSKEGLRIFLMDLGLENPTLHEILGLPNEEGVSDAFLFGASIQHIARPAMDGTFFFAPAGSVPGDPEEVLGHSRWNDLAGGFSEADATLLLFLPSGIRGADRILSRATDIVFLSAQGESPEIHLGPSSIKLVMNVGPLGSPPEEAPPVVAEFGDETDEEPATALFEEDGIQEVEPEAESLEGAEEDEVTLPPFDFAGGFELAEGFREPEVVETEGEEEGEGGTEEATGLGFPEEESEAEEGATEEVEEGPGLGIAGDITLDEADETGDSQLFGDGLTMGSSLLEEDDSARTPPDFGAEFVELGGEEDQEAEGDFGADLVQGADFGGPAPATAEGLREAPAEDLAGEGLSQEEEIAETPGPEAPREPPRRRTPPKKPFPFGKAAGIVLLLGLIGAAVGTAMGVVNVPGLTFLSARFGDLPDPPLALAGPQANEDILRYSLVLFTYEEGGLADAREMLEALRSRLPELLFALAPGEEDGRTIFTLLAGPAYDRIEAENLRGPLSEVLTREDPDAWGVRETPRGFYLGERETLPEAREYLESFSMEGVYPYILHVTYPDGAEAFEILAGAYGGIPDARPLQRILRENGFHDLPLIERRGRLPE